MIQKDVGYPVTMFRYPREAAWLLDLRDRVNRRLTETEEL